MMTHIPNFTIQKLSNKLLAEYTHFFDNIAFKDHPEWSHCYCNCFYADSCKPWDQYTKAENKQAILKRIEENTFHGYLAFSDGVPIGWCAANVKTQIPVFSNDTLDPKIGSILCFVVAKPFRRKGVARALLEKACMDFKNTGIHVIEAYPRKPEQAESEASNHFGHFSLYQSVGFQIFSEDQTSYTVQKTYS